MRSDALFCLGYALFWIGLFAATSTKRLLRWIVILLFHATTILVVVVNTSANQYFQENGSTLDYSTVAEWIPKFGELMPIFFKGVPLLAWVLLAAALFYAALGPLLMRRLVERRRRRTERLAGGAASGGTFGSFFVCFGLLVLALGLGGLSLFTIRYPRTAPLGPVASASICVWRA